MSEMTPDEVSHVGGPSFSSSSSSSSSTGVTTTPKNAAPIQNSLPQQRVRKRSFFGKLSKPAIPSEPMPTLQQQQQEPQQQNAVKSEEKPSERKFLSASSNSQEISPKIHTSERSPVRNFVLRRGHGRSPSTSALPSHSPSTLALFSQDDQSGSSPHSSQSHSREFRNQSSQPSEETNSSEALSQSLGRKSGAMNALNQSPAWYNRGPMAKAHVLSSSIVRGRDRSASVASNRSNFKKEQSSWEKDANQNETPLRNGTIPSSPVSIRRTFSRKSVYSSQGTEDASSEQNEQIRSVEDTPNVKAKRRLFGRPSRAHDNLNSPAASSTGRQQHDRLSLGTSTGAHGFIRRVSSRSLLRSNNESAEMDPMASTDSLVSNSANSISRGITRRAGEVISKTTSFANWNRKSRSTISIHEELDENANPALESKDKQEKAQNTTEFGSMKDEVLIDPPSSPSGNDVNEAGIPKRLSGWFFNILGTESETMSESKRDTIPISDSTATLKQAPNNVRLSNDNQSARKVRSQSPTTEASDRLLDTSTATPRSRTAGLLSTLAVSGRNRAEGNNASTSNSSASGALGTGVNAARSGLDRALRYFIDNSDHHSDSDTGAWLLGVWHGPSEKQSPLTIDTSSGLRPAIDVSIATPERENTDRISTNVENATSSSKRDSEQGLEDNSSLASSAQRTGETSPSITSASSKGSFGRKKGRNEIEAFDSGSGDEAPVLAHNPPTPQTSPILSQTQSSSSSSQTRKNGRRPFTAGTESGSNLVNAINANADNHASFQLDFSSRIWCTYRSHFTPISRDGAITAQSENAAAISAANTSTLSQDSDQNSPQKNTLGISPSNAVPASTPSRSTQQLSTSPGSLGVAFGINSTQSSSPSNSAQYHNNQSGGGVGLGERMGIPNLWNRATAAAQAYGLAGRSGLTTDAGWGCMLRTGQSVLANALIDVHLGRSWRRNGKPLPLRSPESSDSKAHQQWKSDRRNYMKYVQLLTWFMDEPSLACPFGVHRMAREGKRLGKEVGEWFGPSTAAGAIKKLVDEFPTCGLGVNVASDGVIYLDQVKGQASISSSSIGHKRNENQRWERPVLILIGVRLGLEGVHPMYHDSIKATFSFPQSVGIAGGRPSSSYYFVGYQGNSLFYLDPHHVRPSINFKHPPPNMQEDENWWINAYSEQELASYHNDRPRRMPMKSLDPSMLLGFLLQNEADLSDFVERVKCLPRPIFSVLDSMPKWMMDDLAYDDEEAEEKAIESISESSADDFEIQSSVTPEAGNQPEADENVNSTLKVGRKENCQNSTFLDKGKQSQAGKSLSTAEGQADDHSQNLMTPQSETTFELVSPYTPAQRSLGDKHFDFTKNNLSQSIAFPTLSTDEEEEEQDRYETKVRDGRREDPPSTPPRISQESIQERSTLSSSPSKISSIHHESPRVSQTLSIKEKKVRRASSGGSGSDIESAWEDLQGDTFSSPKMESFNSWSHADAIIKRAEGNNLQEMDEQDKY